MPTHPYMSRTTGKRVAGVTTVNGNIGWNRDILMGWANREGLAGRDTRARGSSADKAASIGDYIHDAIEVSIIWGRPAVALPSTPADLLQGVEFGLSGYRQWAGQTQGTIVATELWGVDEEYQTGWCLDALRLEDTGLALVDWKSSGGTYAEHFIQVAAYTVFEEKRLTRWLGEGPDGPLPEPVRFTGAHVVRFDKESGMFSHKFWPRPILDVGWRAFTWARALHEVRWTIEKYTR